MDYHEEGGRREWAGRGRGERWGRISMRERKKEREMGESECERKKERARERRERDGGE